MAWSRLLLCLNEHAYFHSDLLTFFSGYCVDLAERMAKHVGFEYRIELVKDSKYGAKVDTGNNITHWNGMIGELIRRVCFQHDPAHLIMFISFNRSCIMFISAALVFLAGSICTPYN